MSNSFVNPGFCSGFVQGDSTVINSDIIDLLEGMKITILSNIFQLRTDMQNYVNSKFVELNTILSKDKNIFDFNVSLNGAYGTYLDGSSVYTSILPGSFKILGSFIINNDGFNYIVCYKLIDESGNICYLPNTLIEPKKSINP